MARRIPIPTGSWLLVEELLENGDDAFLVELRRINDADRLGSFAAVWYKDRRAASRRMLLKYLEMPFNCYRHEALVKRLFKLAEAANDDEVMARYLVGLDRSLRRVKRKRYRYDWSSRQSWTEETLRVPAMTAMPRTQYQVWFDARLGQVVSTVTPEAIARTFLFSTATRKYLRRRAWRYFRQIGKADPKRYIDAVTQALLLYTDRDCRNGLELIDNWGLIHVLFHDSSVLSPRANGWVLKEGQALSALQPKPAFPDAWGQSAQPLLALVGSSQCRPIRQWAISMLRSQHSQAFTGVSLTTILRWLASDDEELSLLAVDLLEGSTDLSRLTLEDWLELTRKAHDTALVKLCQLMRQRLAASQVPLPEIVQLCCARAAPISRLGLDWLKDKPLTTRSDCDQLRAATDSKCEATRAEFIALVIEKLEASGHSSRDDRLEFLDAPHLDSRQAGWAWLLESEKTRDDPDTWQKLLESPYDDVRLKLVQLLENRQLELQSAIGDNPPLSTRREAGTLLRARMTPETLRLLWITVLLNIHRGGKQKPGVIRSIVATIEEHPEQLGELLPLFQIALRSVRAGEWRSALAGMVRMVEQKPEFATLIQSQLPELVF
jgi:hypothetical protein